ncbi:MAG: S1 RNA-binding domain-containing protein [Lachnospiraceae bacterium]|nr:S1 RNA-binding domain-containing protein [Lachnospiraceae bacterium]
MQIEVGSILEGKVTGITKFGAFVELAEGKSGMVHISEISSAYVENVSDFLSEGQTVKVKVLAIGDNGKISLSMKQTAENPNSGNGKQNNRGGYQKRGGQQNGKNFHNDNNRGQRRTYNNRPPVKSNNSPGDFVWQKSSTPTSFEDMMSKFKQQSDEKISSLKKGGENPMRRARRKG